MYLPVPVRDRDHLPVTGGAVGNFAVKEIPRSAPRACLGRHAKDSADQSDDVRIILLI